MYTNDHLDFGLPNGIGPEVTAMKQASVDVIFACIDLNGVKTLAQEMQRQGIRQSVKIVHTNTYDQKFVQDAGNLFDGDIVAVGFRPFEADPGQSELKDFHEWMAKDGKTETEMAMNGWINADLAYDGLKAAGAELRPSQGHRCVQHAVDVVHRRRVDATGRLEPSARRPD